MEHGNLSKRQKFFAMVARLQIESYVEAIKVKLSLVENFDLKIEVLRIK